MSQITSRILVRVTSPQVWERFKGEYYEEVGGNFLDYIDMNFREFSIEDSWSCWPDDLETLVTCIAEILGKDGIIIADSDNINTDPTNFYAYYFGEKVHFGYLENKFHSGEMEEYDYYFDVCEIGDIAKWLNYGKYSLKKSEKNLLLRFGIQYREGRYTSFMFENLNLPEQIRLSQTDSSEFADCVEKTKVGELATLLDATEPGGKPRIKVVGKAGVLGYLPYNLSENLMPALFMENPNINVTVTEVVCRPHRKKNPKGPYLSIHIENNNGIQTSSEKSLDETQYCYCYVGFSDWSGWYFSDFDVEVGELVIAPFGRYQKEKAGIIDEIRFGTLDEAPFSPEKLKHLKRKFGMFEPAELQDEKYQIWNNICKYTNDYQKLTYNLNEMCESGKYALSGPILYQVLESEVVPCCWAENPSVQHINQVIIPAIVSGKPVLRFQGSLHMPNWAVELKIDHLILSEGIRYLEADSYLLYGTKKVFLPASIEGIDSNIFSDSRGTYKDLYLHDDLIFYTPAGSYADYFLKAYKPQKSSYSSSSLLVINQDTPNN